MAGPLADQIFNHIDTFNYNFYKYLHFTSDEISKTIPYTLAPGFNSKGTERKLLDNS